MRRLWRSMKFSEHLLTEDSFILFICGITCIAASLKAETQWREYQLFKCLVFIYKMIFQNLQISCENEKQIPAGNIMWYEPIDRLIYGVFFFLIPSIRYRLTKIHLQCIWIFYPRQTNKLPLGGLHDENESAQFIRVAFSHRRSLLFRSRIPLWSHLMNKKVATDTVTYIQPLFNEVSTSMYVYSGVCVCVFVTPLFT